MLLILSNVDKFRAETRNYWSEITKTPLGIFYFRGATDLDLGVNYYRIAVGWPEIEPQEGKFNWNARQLEMINKIIESGAEVIPTIKCGQDFWGVKKGSKENFASLPPRDLEEKWNPGYGFSKSYYNFLFSLLSHYRGRIKILAVENEANASNFWGGTLDEYVRLLRTARKAARDVDRKIVITDSGIAHAALALTMGRDMIEEGSYADEEVLEFMRLFLEGHSLNLKYSFENISDLYDYLYSENGDNLSWFVHKYFKKIKKVVDAVNFHFYGNPSVLDELVDWLKSKTRNLPLVCNELGIRTLSPSYDYDYDQAKDLFKKVHTARSSGIGLFIWFPFEGSHGNVVSLFKNKDELREIPVKAFSISSEKINSHQFLYFREKKGIKRFFYSRPGSSKKAFEASWPEGKKNFLKVKYPGLLTAYDCTGIPISLEKKRKNVWKLQFPSLPVILEYQ